MVWFLNNNYANEKYLHSELTTFANEVLIRNGSERSVKVFLVDDKDCHFKNFVLREVFATIKDRRWINVNIFIPKHYIERNGSKENKERLLKIAKNYIAMELFFVFEGDVIPNRNFFITQLVEPLITFQIGLSSFIAAKPLVRFFDNQTIPSKAQLFTVILFQLLYVFVMLDYSKAVLHLIASKSMPSSYKKNLMQAKLFAKRMCVVGDKKVQNC